VSGFEHADDPRGQLRELQQLALRQLARESVDAVGQDLHRAPQLEQIATAGILVAKERRSTAMNEVRRAD